MIWLSNLISIIYYLFIAYIGVIIILNLIKNRRWSDDILYVIVLLPFLLRLFRLK